MDSQGSARVSEPDQEDAIFLAESLREDFIKLMAIFDRQLTGGDEVVGMNRSSLTQARIAAETGLRLSDDLRELLGKNL